jgi:hypothetical protein
LLLLLGLKSWVVSWYKISLASLACILGTLLSVAVTACASPLLPLFVPNADENSFWSVRILEISLAESLL